MKTIREEIVWLKEFPASRKRKENNKTDQKIIIKIMYSQPLSTLGPKEFEKLRC